MPPAALILVVDHEPRMRAALTTVLTLDGYRVVEAACGAEALAVCDQCRALGEPIDLIVLDMMLADMTGIGLLHRLQQRRVGTQIVAVSASAAALEAALQAGAAAVLRKPFALPRLLAIVARYCA